MRKPNLFRRIAMRVLLWILRDEEQSRTCELNRVLYERSSDGRNLAHFCHPQMEVGEHTYGLRREWFIAYHPDDRVRVRKYLRIGASGQVVFLERPTHAGKRLSLRALRFATRS